jgi:2,3-bisphosphoglycerate-independent phosphoglycerate mutase
VPCLIIDKSNWRLSTEGGLSNLAPTVLHLMGLPKPEGMKGKSLLLEEFPKGQSPVGAY